MGELARPDDPPPVGRGSRRGGRPPAGNPPVPGGASSLPPPQARKRLHHDLRAWFARVGRELPWRNISDPYRTWVSETMLQQTQVERVVDYYHRFLDRFPTVDRLAAAAESDVLRAWEGLGYYRRARQLHAAARRVVAEHDGRLPDTEEGLRALPGVGRYTASAILSIAFGKPFPVVEANSRRVLARLAGYEGALGGTSGDGPVWEIAAGLLPDDAPGDWNQALMDLGAIVCTPRAPACARCPVAGHCRAHATGRVAAIPAMAARRRVEERRERVLVARDGGRVLVVRRGPGEWWEGLWDFPRLPAAGLVARLGGGRPRRLGSLAYTVTHHRVRVEIVACDARRAGPRRRGARWIAWSRLGSLAMTAPGRRIARMAAAAFAAADRGAVATRR